jgi:hypothetical protein
MHAENEGLTPELLRQHLRVMADVEVSEQTTEKFYLFVGLVSMMKMLQPEGFQQSVPAVVFHAVKE